MTAVGQGQPRWATHASVDLSITILYHHVAYRAILTEDEPGGGLVNILSLLRLIMNKGALHFVLIVA